MNDPRLILLVRAADRAGEHRTARPARWDAMTARRPEGAPAVRPVNGSLVGQHGAAGDEDVGSPGRIRSAAGSPAGIPGAARAAAARTHRENSVSAPFLIAEMLGQAADALGSLKGRHVIEFGSGGYNASLLRELVGPSGSVTTVDIDPDVTDRAAACLEAAGYNDVTAVCADAEHPIEPGRRYDLIIVTAGAWDIPP